MKYKPVMQSVRPSGGKAVKFYTITLYNFIMEVHSHLCIFIKQEYSLIYTYMNLYVYIELI